MARSDEAPPGPGFPGSRRGAGVGGPAVKRLAITPLLCAWLLAPTGGAAHPHVFIEAGAGFVVDAEGRLAAVQISHIYDPLMTLLVLQEMGIDPFAALDPEASRSVAADQALLFDETGGFAALSVAGEAVALAPAQGIAARVEDDRLRIDFTRPLAAPAALDGRPARLAIYDPVYFIAFDLTGPVTVAGGTGCEAKALAWQPTEAVLALQAALADLPVDETPAEKDVGRLFAAEAQLTCR
jgi:ABC-type uncharacterized transport system substrate-binding protein